MDDIDKKDLKALCRVCLNTSCFKMKSLFDTTNAKIVQDIEFCTGITLQYEASKPFQICSSCLYSLTIAHEFKTACLKSEDFIRDNLNAVKVEVDNFDDDDIDDVPFCPDQEDVKCEPQSLELENDCDNEEPDVSKPEGTDKCVKENIKKVNIRPRKYNKTGEPKPRKLKKLKYKRLYCETCDIKFKSRKESETHKDKFHTESLGWICEVCGKTLGHRGSMATHVRSHLPPEYRCDRCGYGTNIKSDLVKHLKIHTGLKQYECPLCVGRAYYTKSNLRQHMRRRHEGGEVRRFACNRGACGKTFEAKSKLLRHLDTHDNIKRHACTVCESAFTRRCYLKKHLEKHHNIVIPRLRPGRQKELSSIIGINDYEIT